VTFIGHSHLCKAFAIGRERVYEVVTRQFEIRPEFRYVVSVGSVGQPRDHDPRASYTVYDTARRHFEFKRVEYDVREAAQRIFDHEELSDSFGARLFAGV
jgi:diadenosine tetraphosphatase ApaH/serine/threonine PP2A family protein phosphatase